MIATYKCQFINELLFIIVNYLTGILLTEKSDGYKHLN